MPRWVTKFLDKLGSPELDWVQVEVTSRCNAACIYCPQPLLYRKQHMPFSLFKQLLPYLGYTDLVYLQGWGEPLLNPDLFAMIRACKKKGKRVGFTTNGMLLSEEVIHRLVDLETDIISVSLAGTSPATHNRIRKGTDLVIIIENLERLQRIKTEKGTEYPALHFSYLMLAANIHELKGVVEPAKRLGAGQIVCSNLTLITDETMWTEALFNREEEEERLAGVLEGIAEEVRRENLLFAYGRPILQKQPGHCSENIRSSCVVSVTGEVSPCVFASPTLSQPDRRNSSKPLLHIYQNSSVPCYPLTFGNIGKESLTRIWNKKEYEQFRSFHDPDTPKTGINMLPVPQSCASCYKREA
ncbi:MAG: Radical protein [Thermodesulfobacteriota bacterium]|nr:Radical protein [Thermodesulfobacteriota bacterium]